MKLIYNIIVLCLGLFLSLSAKSELKIDVSGAVSEPTPIAIPYFVGDSEYAKTITDILVSDLERTGLFRLVNRDAYIQSIEGINTRPIFKDWQAINAHALLYGTVEKTETGDLKVSYRLWDIFAQSQMDAKVLSTKLNAERKIAHMIADSVY